jgi:hypothetical protein
MDELRELNSVPGLPIKAYKQSDSHIACKMILTVSDAKDLCNRTRSGLFKNKDFHDMFINTIVTALDNVIEEENQKIHASK